MQASANLNLMIKAARRAGRSLAKDFREVESLQASQKGAVDFVDRASIAAEEIIKQDLVETRVNYGWLSKISGDIAGTDPTRRWIVSPLSGYKNYLHGQPHWAVSIALEYKGEIVSGVVYDPSQDETYFSEKGQGAWMNESRLRVAGRRNLNEAIFATSMPFSTGKGIPEALQELARLLPACAGTRQWGSPALNMVYAAAGRVDGYWQRDVDIWDTAAAMIVLREAGGFIESLNANKDKDIFANKSILCANEHLFERFAKIIRGA